MMQGNSRKGEGSPQQNNSSAELFSGMEFEPPKKPKEQNQQRKVSTEKKQTKEVEKSGNNDEDK